VIHITCQEHCWLTINITLGDSRRSSTCSTTDGPSSKLSSRCSTRTSSETEYFPSTEEETLKVEKVIIEEITNDPKDLLDIKIAIEDFNDIIENVNDNITQMVEDFNITENPFIQKNNIHKHENQLDLKIKTSKKKQNLRKVPKKDSFSGNCMPSVLENLDRDLNERKDGIERKPSISIEFPKRTKVNYTIEEWLKEKMRFGFSRAIQADYLTEISYEEDEEFIDFEPGVRRIFDPYYSLEIDEIVSVKKPYSTSYPFVGSSGHKDETSSVEGKTNSKGYPCAKALVTTTSGDELYGNWTDGVR